MPAWSGSAALLERVLRTLLDPLHHPDWHEWHRALQPDLLQLTEADAVCVHAPLADVGGAGRWYAPHLPPAALDAYVARAAIDPQWDVIHAAYAAYGRVVAHESELVSAAALRDSAFHAEFLRPHRLFDVTVAGIEFGAEAPARLHVSRTTMARGMGDESRSQEAAGVIRALLPAFEAGYAAWHQFATQRTDLARMVDVLSVPVLLYEISGTLVHANPAAARLLTAAPTHGPDDVDRIRGEARGIAWSVGALVARGRAVHGGKAFERGAGGIVRTVRVGIGPTARTITLRGTLAPPWLLGRDPGVLVSLEAAPVPAMSDADLRARFGLTPRELDVARLVADGLSNQQVGAHLGTSFYTARNHVKRLMAKLGAHNRTHVAALLRHA